MKKIYLKNLLLTLSAVFLAFSMQAQTVYADYVDGMVWVKVNPDAQLQKTISLNGNGNYDRYNLSLNDAPFLADLSKEVNFTKIERPFEHVKEQGLNRIFRLTFDNPTQVDYVMEELNRLPSIEYAERVELLKTTLTPNDPDFNPGDQWSLYQINADNAWNLSTGDANIVVSIVDDAVEITHSDLSGAIWTNTGEIPNNGIDDDGNGYVDDVQGYDVANSDNDPGPDAPVNSYDHGTHVAGIAGASTDNNTGMASIGFGVSLMAVKSTNSASAVTHGYDGIVYSVASGADVINMSWGGSGSSATAQSIIDYAYGNNIVCIAAAGNDNVSSTFYPAGYNNVISVASTTTGDAKSGFSNYGTWIDISAPGSGIWSTVPNNGYAIKQGTSMASPLVAGLAGLMLSFNPGLLPSDIETCLLSTATNIDGANPSYVGELGAGRIDAFAAMNCIAGTQSLAPVAEFTSGLSVIVEGQTVDFTDLSYYNPDTWSWTFNGGTPSTFNGQTPPSITYSTAGTYDVTLTVSNGNGNDTETKVGYVVVNGLSGCDTVTNTIPSDQNFTWNLGANGYINGTNDLAANEWAEQYSGYGNTNVTGAEFYFTQGSDAGGDITVKVYEDNAGEPGTVVYTQTVPLSEIAFNAAGPGPGSFYITNVVFNNPVAVTTDPFYVGFEVPTTPGDTAVCAMSDDLSVGDPRPNTVFAYLSAGNGWGPAPIGWYDASLLFTGNPEWAAHIYPRTTDAPLTANITTNSPICDGDFMNFDASGSTNAVSWDWAINGTTDPYPTGATPSVLSAIDGSHWAYMQIFNYCGFSLIDSVLFQVDPTPDLVVTTTADTICPGGSVDLTATGATSYTWNPGALTGGNQTVSPSSTTTYSVIGTTGACSSESIITIEVDDNPPVADFVMSDDTVCVNGFPLDLNGGISANASTYNWTFTGGDITNSTSANPSVNYDTPGTYTFDLTVENTCGQTDNITGQVIVVDGSDCSYAGIEDGTEIPTITYQDLLNDIIYIQFGSTINDQVKLELFSPTGQVVYSESISDVIQAQTFEISTAGLQPAVYMLRISTENRQSVEKLFVK